MKKKMVAKDFEGDPMARGPPGWTVEPRPRTNENYKGKIDWFYYDPSGKQHRSYRKAWAHYEATKRAKTESTVEEMTLDGCSMDSQNAEVLPVGSSSQSNKRDASREHKPNMKELARMKERTASFDVDNTPESVTWVLTDADNDKWTAYVGDEMVPQAEQKLWEETFIFAMAWEDWPGSSSVNDEQKDKADQAELEADQAEKEDKADQAEEKDKADQSENE